MGAAPNRRSLRLWAALQSAQGGARKACGRSPKPTQLPPLGLISRKGNIRSWNHRRAMAGDSGRDVRLGRNRTGETAGASPGLSGKAEAAGPVLRSPVPPSEGRAQWRLRFRAAGRGRPVTVSREESAAERSWPEARTVILGRRGRRFRRDASASRRNRGGEPGASALALRRGRDCLPISCPEAETQEAGGRVGGDRRPGGSRERLPQAASPRKRQLPRAILPGP